MLLTVAYPQSDTIGADAWPDPMCIRKMNLPFDDDGGSSRESSTHISISRINVPLVMVLIVLSFVCGVAITFGIQLANRQHDEQTLVKLDQKLDRLTGTVQEIHERQAVQETAIKDIKTSVDQVTQPRTK